MLLFCLWRLIKILVVSLVCLYMYVWSTHACMYVCLYGRVHVQKDGCIYACMHACMHVCMYVCMRMYRQPYSCRCVCGHIDACLPAPLPAHVRRQGACTPCIDAQTCALLQSIQMCLHALVFTYIYAHIYIYT